MKKLNKGEFIVIKFEKKFAHAKVVAHVPEKKRLNVFTQGTLKWIDDTDYVGMATHDNCDLKKGVFIEKPKGGETTSFGSIDPKNLTPIPAEVIEMGVEKLGAAIDKMVIEKLEEIADGGADAKLSDGTMIDINTVDMVEHGAYPDNISTKELTETDEMYLTPFRKGKSGKTLTVEQVSDMVGKSTPATAHALTRLQGLGFLELLNTELKEYALTIRGLKHVPGNVKPKSDVPKLKTDKQSGEVEVSKKNRVITLLKNPDLTVKQISEMTGAAQSYIRGIRERAAKKMEEPKAGSIKRKVYDALRAGGTLVDVAKRCKVTVSYAYQIRQQMLSAKII